MPAQAVAKMYTRELRRRKSKAVIKMDPDCAICQAPAHAACDCEAKGLDVAIKQAEDRIMSSIYSDIRTWVRAHAQDHILEYFRQLADRRKAAHSKHLDTINANAWYNYNAPPHPQQLADAQAHLKRGIDEDWQASVQRYPEVLQHFFGLVDLTLPPDDDPTVMESPLSPPDAHRKPARRGTGGAGSRREAPPAIMPAPYPDRSHGMPPRTPPEMDRYERRTPERRVPVHAARDREPRERDPRERDSRERRPREHSIRHSLPPTTAPYAPYAPY